MDAMRDKNHAVVNAVFRTFYEQVCVVCWIKDNKLYIKIIQFNLDCCDKHNIIVTPFSRDLAGRFAVFVQITDTWIPREIHQHCWWATITDYIDMKNNIMQTRTCVVHLSIRRDAFKSISNYSQYSWVRRVACCHVSVCARVHREPSATDWMLSSPLIACRDAHTLPSHRLRPIPIAPNGNVTDGGGWVRARDWLGKSAHCLAFAIYFFLHTKWHSYRYVYWSFPIATPRNRVCLCFGIACTLWTASECNRFSVCCCIFTHTRAYSIPLWFGKVFFAMMIMMIQYVKMLPYISVIGH